MSNGINHYHKSVMRGLQNLLRMETDKYKKIVILELIEDMKAGNASVQQQLWAAKMLGLRNPDFDGDYIGRWDDDDEDE
jgi:hypothetical protein